MSQERHFRRHSHALMFRAGLASVVLFALLNARDIPSHFQTTSKTHSTLTSDSQHDQRPRFDHYTLDWNVAAPTILPFPTFDKSAHPDPSAAIILYPSNQGIPLQPPASVQLIARYSSLSQSNLAIG